VPLLLQRMTAKAHIITHLLLYHIPPDVTLTFRPIATIRKQIRLHIPH